MGITNLIPKSNEGSGGDISQYESFYRYYNGITLNKPNEWFTLYEENKPGYIDLLSIGINNNHNPKQLRIIIDEVQAFCIAQVTNGQYVHFSLANINKYIKNNNNRCYIPCVSQSETNMLSSQIEIFNTNRSSNFIFPLGYNNESSTNYGKNRLNYRSPGERLSTVAVPLNESLYFKKSIKVQILCTIQSPVSLYHDHNRMYISGGIKK